MIFLISPAKTLDFESSSFTSEYTEAEFLNESQQLISIMRDYNWHGLHKLMGVSEKIAKLNVARFQDWVLPFTEKNAKQAVFAFKGDVYTGLAVETMTKAELNYIQSSLRILSGLYGLLKPMDLMQAYRLEMGTKVKTERLSSLYDFWGDKLTSCLNRELGVEDVLVNLASNEYYKSVQAKKIKSRIVTPVFKDYKGDKYKIISFYAKKARGLMVRYAADHQISDVEALKGFNYAGYYFSEEASSQSTWVFLRDAAKA
ncbi:MAG: cytoplasmic iron level regulating protein YaaA (DUF328/UPF0246 family) [Pseudohongiellaceae bacterium]|jgi:cytoplasmic iron level regulating protein YaaA (DUF328/UPF0246 family)